MEQQQVRQLLPAGAVKYFDDIVEERVLGSSNHSALIAKMFLAISQQSWNQEEKLSRIQAVKKYFMEKRGQDSYAIITSLNLMTKGIEDCDDLASLLERNIEDYTKDTKLSKDLIATYTNSLLKDKYTVMVFDYSSTVEKAIAQVDHKLKVYVPESRAIDGGKPFVQAFLQAQHEVCFILDVAMLSVLKECDAVFIGAETFYRDGTAFNTIGSSILAELCANYKIPYYVLTPMIKLDSRYTYQSRKKAKIHDLSDKLSQGWQAIDVKQVNFETIEMDAVEPRLITAYVSEQGITAINDLEKIAKAYDEAINGGKEHV